MYTELKQLIIGPDWPQENPAGDGASTPVTVFPSFGETGDDPGQGDNLDNDTPPGPNSEDNSTQGNNSPDTRSK